LLVSDVESPFGEEVKIGSMVASDKRGTVGVGRLYPLPVYFVQVKSITLSKTRLFIGWRRAVLWANSAWNILAPTEDGW
jgi:hypothetical protein